VRDRADAGPTAPGTWERAILCLVPTWLPEWFPLL